MAVEELQIMEVQVDLVEVAVKMLLVELQPLDKVRLEEMETLIVLAAVAVVLESQAIQIPKDLAEMDFPHTLLGD